MRENFSTTEKVVLFENASPVSVLILSYRVDNVTPDLTFKTLTFPPHSVFKCLV